MKRKRFNKELREAIINKYGGKCVFCGNRENLHIDHIFPLKLGGTNTETNLQVLCSRCNTRKNCRYPTKTITVEKVVYAENSKVEEYLKEEIEWLRKEKHFWVNNSITLYEIINTQIKTINNLLSIKH